MLILNDWTNPPEKSLHPKNRSALTERRWRPNFVFHKITKHDLSVSSSCCAPWNLTGDTQPYMCYYYVLVTPTFDVGKKKTFVMARAVSRANAALWGRKVYLGFRRPEKSINLKKQTKVDSERRWQPNFVFHKLTKHDLSVSSSCCAPWRFTGDTQPYMCYCYVLVSPTFGLGFRIEKRNAGKNYSRRWVEQPKKR